MPIMLLRFDFDMQVACIGKREGLITVVFVVFFRPVQFKFFGGFVVIHQLDMGDVTVLGQPFKQEKGTVEVPFKLCDRTVGLF